MSGFVVKNVKAWLEGYDISSRCNAIGLNASAAMLNNTTFGATTTAETFLKGLESFRLNYSGLYDTATVLDPDAYISAEQGYTDTIITLSPDGGDLGDAAFSVRIGSASYTPIKGGVGALGGFTLSANGNGLLIRGKVMENSQKTSTGTGTARELRGLDEGDIARVCVHVTEFDATSLDIIIASDTDVAFGSATTRDFGLTQFTAVGAQIGSYTAGAGISADDCWRIGWTLVGTSVTIVVNLYVS